MMASIPKRFGDVSRGEFGGWMAQVKPNFHQMGLDLTLGQKVGNKLSVVEPVELISSEAKDGAAHKPSMLISHEAAAALYEALRGHFEPEEQTKPVQSPQHAADLKDIIDHLLPKIPGPPPPPKVIVSRTTDE